MVKKLESEQSPKTITNLMVFLVITEISIFKENLSKTN